MKRDFRRVIISSGIANTFEWYDYALFGSFASLIGEKFFPNSDPNASIMNAFLVFAVGYLMRPIGGIFFGIIGDTFGRKAALSSALICMSLPTALIGLLPTYQDIGVTASVLMVLMRMLQGLSMGGALTGSISFLIEHSKKNNRGLMGSIPMASICLGILLGTLVSIGIKSIMSHEKFLDYGWRIPFLIGIVVMLAGFYISKYTKETPLFKDLKERGVLVSSPLSYVFKNHWKDMLISVMINSTGSVIFYFQAVYIANYLKINRDFPEISVDKTITYSYILMAFSTILSGFISDLIGRKRLYFLIIIFTIFSISTITGIIQFGDWPEVIIAQVVLALIGAFYIGPEPALQAELYPTKVRSTALSVSYNFSTSLFGGTTPYIISYLYYKTESLSGCAGYVIIVSIISLIGLYFYDPKLVSDADSAKLI